MITWGQALIFFYFSLIYVFLCISSSFPVSLSFFRCFQFVLLFIFLLFHSFSKLFSFLFYYSPSLSYYCLGIFFLQRYRPISEGRPISHLGSLSNSSLLYNLISVAIGMFFFTYFCSWKLLFEQTDSFVQYFLQNFLFLKELENKNCFPLFSLSF